MQKPTFRQKQNFGAVLAEIRDHEYHGSKSNFINRFPQDVRQFKYRQLMAVFGGRTFDMDLLNDYRRFLGLPVSDFSDESVAKKSNQLSGKLKLKVA
jgi:hypothetical protein